MNNSKLYDSSFEFSDSTVVKLKKKIITMVALSTLTVAISFGVSFYFAFISSGSAISGQFPELAPIVSKMKSLLFLNTIGLVAVIIASLLLLSRMTVSRIFQPLGEMQKNMIGVSEGLPLKLDTAAASGTFSKLTYSFRHMLSFLRGKELDEIKQLESSLSSIKSGMYGEAASVIEILVNKKKAFVNGEKAERERDENTGSLNREIESVT